MEKKIRILAALIGVISGAISAFAAAATYYHSLTEKAFTQGRESAVTEVILRIEGVTGISLREAQEAVDAGDTSAAADAIAAATSPFTINDLGTPPGFTEVVELQVGQFQELTREMLPMTVTEISNNEACYSYGGNVTCLDFGQQRELGTTGCTMAFIGTSNTKVEKSRDPAGLALLRVRCP